MKRKPIIGITSSDNRNMLMWLLTKFNVQIAGGVVRDIHPSQPNAFDECDGYIISGGEDIDPAMYAEKNIAAHNVNPARDTLEKNIIEHAVNKQKPILGICRGAQMINVACGGSLHQNAQDYYKDFIPTNSLLGKIFVRRLVNINADSLLHHLMHIKQAKVNSLHHQAIKELGNNLIIIAKTEGDMIQAIQNTDTPKPRILGVQWHPELMIFSKKQRAIFKWIVAEADKPH